MLASAVQFTYILYTLDTLPARARRVGGTARPRASSLDVPIDLLISFEISHTL